MDRFGENFTGMNQRGQYGPRVAANSRVHRRVTNKIETLFSERSCVWDCVVFACGGYGMFPSNSIQRPRPKISSGAISVPRAAGSMFYLISGARSKRTSPGLTENGKLRPHPRSRFPRFFQQNQLTTEHTSAIPPANFQGPSV